MSGGPRFSRAYRRGTVDADSVMFVVGGATALLEIDAAADAVRSCRSGRLRRDPVDLLVRLDRSAWRPATTEDSAREMIDRVILHDLLRGLPVRRPLFRPLGGL